MDAKIGALYRVERDVVYRKRARWKLQHRYKMAEQLKKAAVIAGHPNQKEIAKIADQIAEEDAQRLSQEARDWQKRC